jgi:hypothetical protein
MGERLIPAVLKTVVPERVPGVRIPLPPPEVFYNQLIIGIVGRFAERRLSSSMAFFFARTASGNPGPNNDFARREREIQCC